MNNITILKCKELPCNILVSFESLYGTCCELVLAVNDITTLPKVCNDTLIFLVSVCCWSLASLSSLKRNNET